MKLTTLSLLAGAALALTATSASAQTLVKDIVHNTHGNVVKNTFDNCVITKWDSKDSVCANQPKTISGLDKEALTVYFGFNDAGLNPAATAKLEAALSAIKAAGNIESVSIVGYADQIGKNNYNYKLSSRRGDSVRNYLQAHGVDTKGVEVRGFGEDAPISDCKEVKGEELKACLWRDRRVELELNYKK